MKIILNIRLAYILSLAFSISGCNIYKPFECPEIDFTDSLYSKHGYVGDTTSIASLSWKKLFTDNVLQTLIIKGLNNNTDLRIARLKIEETKAALMNSRLSYLPSASLTSQGTIDCVMGSKTNKTYNLAVSTEWKIDLFGKLLNGKRGTEAALENSEAYKQAVQTQLIATIANSYYTLLMLDCQLAITDRTAKTWAESLRVMKVLKRNGQTTEIAVANTEAGKLSADASVLFIKRQISEMENSLSALLGDVPQSISRNQLDMQVFPDTISYGVPLQLLSHRPDIIQAEKQLAMAYYATNTARSAFYPQINLSGTAGWTNSAGGAIINPGEWILSSVASLVQPLFNKGKNIANLKILKARQEEALLAFRQSLLDAGTEVNNALTQWQTAKERISIDKQKVISLKSVLKNTELMMKYSSQNYLEVITAQQSLLQAELNMVSDRFEEIQGIINLYYALGGGRG